MIKVAVADNDKQVINNLKEIFNDINVKPWYFLSLKDLDKKRNEIEFDIYILDIKFPHKSGIDYAKEIRKTNSRAIIIFLTSYEEFAIKGYEVNALDFILKPIEKIRVLNAFTKALEKIKTDKLIKIVENRREIYLRISKIKFIEKSKRKVIFYTNNNDLYETYYTVKGVAKKLPFFIRINQSQLVNPLHIKDVFNDEYHGYVILYSGEKLCFSRRYRKSFDLDYANFVVNYYD